MQSRTDLAPTHSAGALTCTIAAVETASRVSVAASSTVTRTAAGNSSALRQVLRQMRSAPA